MKKRYVPVLPVLVLAFWCVVTCMTALEPGRGEASAQQAASTGTEIGTEELQQILAAGKIPVIDVRPEKEYAISHIPGSVHIFETDVERMAQACPDKSAGPVLYCNGPFCHKTGRVAEKLSKLGYANVKKYQAGLPVWRALGNPAETDPSGFRHVLSADKTAVFVDARSKEEYDAGSVPGAVNIHPGEIEAANQDGRLPYTDHGTRVIVFGKTAAQAGELAGEIAHRAYWNSSYVADSYENLKKAGW